jgi:hypothetical protein
MASRYFFEKASIYEGLISIALEKSEIAPK